MKPPGSPFLQNWRLKSQILVLFDFFCHLPGLIVSCCAFDASKTQTALVSAISGPFLEASGEPFSSKLVQVTPSVAGHAHSCWSRPQSLVTPTVAGHAHGRWSRPRSLVTPTGAGHAPCRWSRPRALVTPPGRSRCVELAASNSLCSVSIPGPAECAKRLNKPHIAA